MITESMVDCTHANLPAVLADHAALVFGDLIAGYATGSPDIRWTDADRLELSGRVIVEIDQGSDGSPVRDATVRDVEQGAWSVAAAVDRGIWDATRPTIYISRSRLGELVAAGWDGDVWVADWTGVAPSSPPQLPAGARFRIVAWQYANRDTYDVSAVFDVTWPDIPVPPTTTIPTPTNWQEAMMNALPQIQEGATGEVVRTVQGLVLARGVVIACDGVFGPKTKAAVELLQGAAKIGVDGIVGPQTWPVLLGIQ